MRYCWIINEVGTAMRAANKMRLFNIKLNMVKDVENGTYVIKLVGNQSMVKIAYALGVMDGLSNAAGIEKVGLVVGDIRQFEEPFR